MAVSLLNKRAVAVSGRSASGRRAAVVVRAQKDAVDVSRRAALGAFVSGAALVSGAAPSLAAFGESANIFGKVTNTSGFVPYSGSGFALLLPSKWNPSKEQDFKGVVLRYEDNGDAVNNFVVIQEKTDKKSIEDFGSPEKALEGFSYLFGKQSFTGITDSEGGFATGRVSAASLLGVETAADKKGTKYYKYDVLVRAADGDEGGRHQLISAAVSGGVLTILKVQIGDKRWFKGAKKDAYGLINSFTVA